MSIVAAAEILPLPHFSKIETMDSDTTLLTTKLISFLDTTTEKPPCVDVRQYLWQNQSDLTSLPSTMAFFIAIYSLIITLGVMGNLLVIISVYRHKSLQSVRNMFIVSLSCSDIVVSILSGTITPITGFSKTWLFGPSLCKLVPLIQGSSLCFSTLTLTSISIDRFILIIFPTGFSVQKRHAFMMIAGNVGLAVAISTPMFFMQRLIDFNQFCGQFCSEDWGENQIGRSFYGTLVFIFQFGVPFIMITFSYSMISLRLSKGMLVNDRSSPEQPQKILSVLQTEQRRLALKRRLRTNRMLMAMVIVFICCWTPSVLFNFLRDYQWLPSIVSSQEYLYGIITHCISMTSTVWNPILYALLNEHFRQAFVDFLQQLRRHGRNFSEERARMSTRFSRLASNAFYNDYMVNNTPQTASLKRNVPNGNGIDKQVLSSFSSGSHTFLPTTTDNEAESYILLAQEKNNNKSKSNSLTPNGIITKCSTDGAAIERPLSCNSRNDSFIKIKNQNLEECSDNDDNV